MDHKDALLLLQNQTTDDMDYGSIQSLCDYRDELFQEVTSLFQKVYTHNDDCSLTITDDFDLQSAYFTAFCKYVEIDSQLRRI
jgi:hypothetical protein